MYLKAPLEKFLEDLGAKKPAPGGGSASGLSGALGAALFLMVINFTLGKEKFKVYEAELKALLEKIEKAKEEFLLLLERDIQAYLEFSRTRKKDFSSPEEKEKTLEELLKKAAQVPLRIERLSFSLLEEGERLIPITNPLLVSDIGVGASFLFSALEGANLNVEVNLPWIKDKKFKENLRRESHLLLFQGKEIKEKILEEVKRIILKGS